MKKILILLTVTVFSLSLFATPAFAGDKQRHRWQGVAIGLGAAILGNAILNSCRDSYPPERVAVVEHNVCCRPCTPPRDCGHWEVRRAWVPPVCERVWNPGHYNIYNQWVPGQRITIENRPGYWMNERVWVVR
jgi:hypothetical protein